MEAVHFLPVQSIQLHWAGNYGGLSLTERIVLSVSIRSLLANVSYDSRACKTQR